MGDNAGTLSQTDFRDIKMGTDSNAPGTPQSQVQNINETNITTGFMVNRRPSSMGVIKFASSRCTSKYQAAGSNSLDRLSKLSRPTIPSRMIPAMGPKY